MEKLFNEEVSGQIKGLLGDMQKPMSIVLFVDDNCESCEMTKQLLTEYSELSDKISLEVHSLKEAADLAKQYDIHEAPSFVMLDDNGTYRGIKFNGIPAGHEINSLISATVEIAKAEIEMPEDLKEQIMRIKEPTNIKVFVTLGCPHCPGAVHKAHILALMNPNIVGEMVEAQTFMELSNKFNVSSVPHIVINDRHSFIGNQPLENFIDEIQRASNG